MPCEQYNTPFLYGIAPEGIGIFAGGRSFIHSILVIGVDGGDGLPDALASEARRNASLEIRITGNLELIVDCNKSELTYSSSVSAIYAHPLWKNGFREESAERRSEKVQVSPIRELKLEWNILIVIVSRLDEAILLPLPLVQ